MNKYILITGAGMHNIGAQAMMYIAVDEMRKRYPEIDIYVKAIKPDDYEKFSFSFAESSPRKTWAVCLPKLLQKVLMRKTNEGIAHFLCKISLTS